MNSTAEEFNKKVHICKFGFESYDHTSLNKVCYNIIGNIYQKEIIFELIDCKNNDMIDVIGFTISDEKMQSLLPLIRWSDFEKYRNLPSGWEFKMENGCNGYRDGWGYKFWGLSETGDSLIQLNMSCIFLEDKLPAYEKLLKWVKKDKRY